MTTTIESIAPTEVLDSDSTPPDRPVAIHVADGNKGGVGKSFLCRTLYQWHLDHGVTAIGVEADVNSPDFKGIYQEVAVARFSEDEHRIGQANAIVNYAIEERQDVIVNLPATVHSAFKLWLESYEILSLLGETNVQLIKWFVCSGEYDSMKSLAVSLNEFSTVPHVVVRNQKYGEWEQFNAEKELQKLIKKRECPVIDLPKLPLRVANTMLQHRLIFAEAFAYRSARYGIAEQAAVRGYLRKAYAEFERTGYLADAN